MTDAFTDQAYAEIRPRFERMGDAITRAHQRMLRLEVERDDEAEIIRITRRAFELTEAMTEAAQAAMACRAAELKAQAAGPWAMAAEPYCRQWMTQADRELPGYTAIALLIPKGETDACVGSTEPNVLLVSAILLSVACKMLGEGAPGVLRRTAEEIAGLRVHRTMPEAC